MSDCLGAARRSLAEYRALLVKAAIFWRSAICHAKTDQAAQTARREFARLEARIDEVDEEIAEQTGTLRALRRELAVVEHRMATILVTSGFDAAINDAREAARLRRQIAELEKATK